MDINETYLANVKSELNKWITEQKDKPSFFNKITHSVQNKINSYIPQKVHDGITKVIKSMVQSVLFGSQYTTSTPLSIETSFIYKEALVKSKIENYRNTGAVEGGITGAGGFLMSVADFPVLIAIKIKLLFEIANIYGFDVKNYKERVFILYIFQLAFSSQQGRNKTFEIIQNWNDLNEGLPVNEQDFDWKTFQQEYRDYIDLAKLAQLIPIVGSAVGAIANYKLIEKLGTTAMMCYRLRILKN